MKPIKKRGAFTQITGMMVGFVGFILIIILAILLISIMSKTSLICSDANGAPTRVNSNGWCEACPSSAWTFNTTGAWCCNATTGVGASCFGANITATREYWGDAYNATRNLKEAAILPPQFASLLVIVLVIVGILSSVAMIGYNVYKKIKE